MNFGKENESLEFKKTTGELRDVMDAVRTIQRSIDKLKQKGKIARIGNKNYGYWKIIE